MTKTRNHPKDAILNLRIPSTLTSHGWGITRGGGLLVADLFWQAVEVAAAAAAATTTTTTTTRRRRRRRRTGEEEQSPPKKDGPPYQPGSKGDHLPPEFNFSSNDAHCSNKQSSNQSINQSNKQTTAFTLDDSYPPLIHSNSNISPTKNPPNSFFWGWGNPTKYGKTIFPSTALIFYQLLNHLSVHDDVEATLKLVKSEGKGALDRGVPWTLLEMTFGRWIGLPECKSAKVLVEIYIHIMCVYIYKYMGIYACCLFTHTYKHIHIYIYIYQSSAY